jgi:hypothetical protein
VSPRPDPDGHEQARDHDRFTRTGPDTLLYEFTVEGPTVWTQPWSAALPMARTGQP